MTVVNFNLAIFGKNSKLSVKRYIDSLLPLSSHYQVMILRLSSPSAPTESPDNLYPRGYTFTNHTDAHTTVDSQVPYIAAEMAGNLFTSVFTLGGGGETIGTGETRYDNGKLTPGSYYSCFLRAFPKTFYDRPFKRRKRADDVLSKRQYDIFTSSNFLPVQQTGDHTPHTHTHTEKYKPHP